MIRQEEKKITVLELLVPESSGDYEQMRSGEGGGVGHGRARETKHSC